jgi:glutaminase
MYEASGDWSVSVGVPAKSGVSGAVWAAIPGDIIMAS